MANRYDLLKGSVPSEPPIESPSKTGSGLEFKFLADTYKKVVHTPEDELNFSGRVVRLFLEGQISAEAYNELKTLYRWQDDPILSSLDTDSSYDYDYGRGSCGRGGDGNGGRC